jgi:hypothetical protein
MLKVFLFVNEKHILLRNYKQKCTANYVSVATTFLLTSVEYTSQISRYLVENRDSFINLYQLVAVLKNPLVNALDYVELL